MTTKTLIDPKDLMDEHLEALKGYAARVFGRGEALNAREEDDRAARVQEFLAIGTSYELTEKELVRLLYRSLFGTKRGCGCAGCKARR